MSMSINAFIEPSRPNTLFLAIIVLLEFSVVNTD